MNKTVPTIEMNPIDDIQHLLEESGCYESEIEMMKTAGTYDASRYNSVLSYGRVH